MENSEYIRIIATAIIIVVYLIILVRICGLRSFSKMTGFDFAITIATGTLMASPIINSKISLLHGLVSVTALFVIQWAVSKLRKRIKFFSKLIDNEPKLLFKNGKFLDDNLSKSRVTKADIVAKMREANATDLSKITAVVLESTGDISVLHGDKEVDSLMLEGVKS